MSGVQQARELLRQGRVADAEAAYRAVLEREPANIEALNVVALGALGKGEIDAALALLERAAQLDAAQPLTQFHLGRAREAALDFERARESYVQALRSEPRMYAARLQCAAMLEKLGRGAEAVIHYVRALQDAQREGKWLNAATTPPAQRPAIQHALEFVRTERLAAFARLMAPAAEKYGADSMRRVERALRIQLNIDAPHFPDPRQRPTFLFMPGLPTQAYLDTRLIPELAELESRTDGIHAELLKLLPSDSGRERVFDNEQIESENLRGSRGAPSWNGYYFYRHGERRADNCAACPVTAAALDQVPLARVRAHAPEVLYSVFTPGTHLLPHRGVTNTRVVGHLPLIIPEQSALSVGGEEHRWRRGRAVVFDDTYEHEAWNRSAEIRVVMIFDLWNPHLTDAERAALAELIPAIGDFTDAVEAG